MEPSTAAPVEISVPTLGRLTLVKFEGEANTQLIEGVVKVEIKVAATNDVEQQKSTNNELESSVKVDFNVTTNAVFDNDKTEFAHANFKFEALFVFSGVDPNILRDALAAEQVFSYIMKAQVNAAALVQVKYILNCMGFNTDKLPLVML